MSMIDRTDRLLAPTGPTPSRRRTRFALFLLLVLFAHAALIAYLLLEDRLGALAVAPPQEIPVEVVTLPPQEAEKLAPPPEPEPPQPAQKQPKEELTAEPEKPEPETRKLIMGNFADDDPRAARADHSSSAANNRPRGSATPAPKGDRAEASAPPVEQAPTAPTPASAPPKPTEQAKPIDDRADAEIVERAAPEVKPEPTPKEPPKEATPTAKAKPKAAKKPPARPVAEQIASLQTFGGAPFASSSAASPYGGGHAAPSYMALLHAMITRRMPPGALHFPGRRAQGLLTFYLDSDGHLTHQAVVQSSGSPALDNAAVSAVRRAAPYPAPPTGSAVRLTFFY